MISFQDYVALREETFDKDEYESSGEFLERILTNLDEENLVRFAYNAANTVRSLMEPQAIRLLEMVAKWLAHDKNFSRQELMANLSIKSGNSATDYANGAAMNAAKAITTNSSNYAPVDHATRAATYSALAYNANSSGLERNSLVEKTLNKFIQFAKSLVADKKHDSVPSNQWFNKNEKDLATIAAWLDSLEEDGKQEIIDQIRQLVQRVDGANPISNQDLAKVIANSLHKEQYLHYIQNIFKR